MRKFLRSRLLIHKFNFNISLRNNRGEMLIAKEREKERERV